MTSSPRLCAGRVSGGVLLSDVKLLQNAASQLHSSSFLPSSCPLRTPSRICRIPYMFLYKGTCSVFSSLALGCCLTLFSGLNLQATRSPPPHASGSKRRRNRGLRAPLPTSATAASLQIRSPYADSESSRLASLDRVRSA